MNMTNRYLMPLCTPLQVISFLPKMVRKTRQRLRRMKTTLLLRWSCTPLPEIRQRSSSLQWILPSDDDNMELEIAEAVEEKIIDDPSLGHYDPIMDLPDYKYPAIELLEDHQSEGVAIDTNELERNKDQIISTSAITISRSPRSRQPSAPP